MPDCNSSSNNNNKKTTITGWTNAVALALESQGVKSHALFEQAEIPYPSTVDPNQQLETNKVTRLYELAVAATGDPSFGLKVSRFMQPGSFLALGYSLFASCTLYECFQRLVRYSQLLTGNVKHTLVEQEDSYRFNFEIINPDACFETQDCWIGSIVHICRNIYRPDFSPLTVDLLRPAPVGFEKNYSHYFKAPVTFSATQSALIIDKVDMHTPLGSGNVELSRRADEIVIEHLARRDRKDVIRQVEDKIIKLLPTGECSKEKIASLLNLSLRSLYNKLEQQNTTYQEILEDLRSTLAKQYIEQHNMTVCEITYLLGFSDSSNFSRAFRRWTGMSPSAYRELGGEL